MAYEDFCDLCCKCWQQKYGCLVIDKDSAFNDRWYRKRLNDFAMWSIDIDTLTWITAKIIKEIVKEITKTSDSIRKKYRALKTDKIEEDIALERHFKLIIDPDTDCQKRHWLQGYYHDWNILFGRKRGTKPKMIEYFVR